MSYYNAVWDLRVWAWTLVGMAVLALALFLLLRSTLFVTPRRFGVAGTVAIFIAAFMLLLFLAVVAFAPRGYEIQGKTLRVRTVMMTFAYDLTQLSDARIVARREVFAPDTWRVVGVSGLFGYYGYFKNSRLGKFLAFVTERNKLVVLHFPERILVVSPHDSEGFLREVKRILEERKTGGCE